MVPALFLNLLKIADICNDTKCDLDKNYNRSNYHFFNVIQLQLVLR